LRFEDSNIDVNSLTTSNYNNKKYNNFFPSATVNYEISDKSSLSLSYSKRINRPRGRFLNPFSTYSSNINVFQGNPDIDPSGLFVEGVPVIISTPINLAKEYRAGFEFNLNYTPYKWWRLNGNFNLFRNETQGNYSYINYLGTAVIQNFDNTALTWTSRVNSKINLPYKIDWQTNVSYEAPQTTAQGKRLGNYGINLAFSKDVLKDKGTIAFNVSDLFNSKKRLIETNIENVVNSYSEMQMRVRQITLSFTYRFNKQKNDREKPRREEGGEGDFMGKP